VENNGKWLNLLGYPFKDIILLSGDRTGIRGDLKIGFTPDSVTLTGNFERTEESIAETWKQVVQIWCDVADRAACKIENEDYEWSKGVGETLITALQAAIDGISMNIRLHFEDVHGDHYEVGYSTH